MSVKTNVTTHITITYCQVDFIPLMPFNRIMSVLTPDTHGSTFGGNPLGSAIAVGIED